MPRLDGRELVRAIRSRQDGAKIPIILMSAARGLADDPKLGHDRFLEKPFDLSDLIEQVSTLAGPTTQR